MSGRLFLFVAGLLVTDFTLSSPLHEESKRQLSEDQLEGYEGILESLQDLNSQCNELLAQRQGGGSGGVVDDKRQTKRQEVEDLPPEIQQSYYNYWIQQETFALNNCVTQLTQPAPIATVPPGYGGFPPFPGGSGGFPPFPGGSGGFPPPVDD